MRSTRRGFALLVLGATMGIVSMLPQARADAARNTWTTYMYQGPGYHYAVVDEVPQASSFDVIDCTGGWCKINYGERIGYLRENIVKHASAETSGAVLLSQPASSVSVTPPNGPCFKANQTGGNGGNAMTIYCQK